MRLFGLFLLFALACLLAAALLHYPLYVLLSGLVEGVRPHRVLYRAAMVLAALGLWPLLRALGMNHRRVLGYGLPRPAFLRRMLSGWLAGVAILALLSGALFALEIRHLRPEGLPGWPRLAGLATGALFAGLLVALIEETFFRGILYTAVRRSSGFWTAALATAAFYASVHFLRPPPLPAGAEVSWGTGLELLLGAFANYHDPLALLDSWAALFAVGLFLALVRERDGHIAHTIGLHAGWVFVIKLTRSLSAADPQAPAAALVGGYDGVIGWLAAGWIGLLGLSLWFRWRPLRP